MKILIVKLSSLGDVVQTLPALEALRNGYPSAEIHWLVEKPAKGILEDNSLLDGVIVLRRRGLFKDPSDLFKQVDLIRGNVYDMVIDFQGLFKSAIWLYLSGSRRRIGFDKGRELSHIFLNERLPPYDRDRHAVLRYLDLARHAGGVVKEVNFPIFFTKREKENALTLIRGGGITECEPFIIVSPGARWETKLWSMKSFSSLVREIIGSLGFKVIITGSASEGVVAEGLASCGEGVVNLVGRTTLKELAYLMKLATFVISVDSGPMHIAAAVGTTVIALFGPTAPWRTGPYGDRHVVLRKDIECSPCFSKKCNDNICMKGITVADVIAGISTLAPGGNGTHIAGNGK